MASRCQRRSQLDKGGVHIHIFVSTNYKNNQFEKKLIVLNTNIWIWKPRLYNDLYIATPLMSASVFSALLPFRSIYKLYVDKKEGIWINLFHSQFTATVFWFFLFSNLSLIHICRKNWEFSPSDVCEWMPHKRKYGTNIRLLLQRYKLKYCIHSITSSRRSPCVKCNAGFHFVQEVESFNKFSRMRC